MWILFIAVYEITIKLCLKNYGFLASLVIPLFIITTSRLEIRENNYYKNGSNKAFSLFPSFSISSLPNLLSFFQCQIGWITCSFKFHLLSLSLSIPCRLSWNAIPQGLGLPALQSLAKCWVVCIAFIYLTKDEKRQGQVELRVELFVVECVLQFLVPRLPIQNQIALVQPNKPNQRTRTKCEEE